MSIYMNFLDACYKNDLAQARLLISNHKDEIIQLANLGCFSEEGMFDNELTINLLIENGANINTQDNFGATALYMASKKNNPSIVKILLDAGADTELQKHGLTPLMVATRKGNLICLKMLVEHGANIDHLDYSGNNVISYAMQSNNPSVLKYLLGLGIPHFKGDVDYLDIFLQEGWPISSSIIREFIQSTDSKTK